MFADKGRSLGAQGLTISEQWLKRGWYVRRGDDRRIAGLSNLRTYLHERLLTICTTPNGWQAVRQMQERVLDENKPEDVRKDDARADGTGGDDVFEEIRRGCLSRSRLPEGPRDLKTGRDPLRELPQSEIVAPKQHAVWNPDGTPCYISPETWEES